MAEGEKGTGKHPHKSTKEPYPHHRGEHEEPKSTGGRPSEPEQRASSAGREQGRKGEEKKSERQGDPEPGDLKQREYKDPSGGTHHHTKKHAEEHKGQK